MGRKRKSSEELARPRTTVAPVQPIIDRPRRSTKDAFYNNLSTLTATRKISLEDEAIFQQKIPLKQPKKEVGRRKSSSTSSAEPSGSSTVPTLEPQQPPQQQKRPVLVKQEKTKEKPQVLKIAIPSSSKSKTAAVNLSNGLHHFISQLRRPHFSLLSLNIEAMSIDPRMQYSCNLCSRRFTRLTELDQHLSSHVENISFCALCEKPTQPFTIDEYTQHLASHFLVEHNQVTCIFCGEISANKSAAELAQHLLFYCPSIRYCFLCESEIEENKAHQHRKKQHSKLLNRYVCSTCFLGFPSLLPFLSHICDMRYRCLCEITDVFMDHHTINQHIAECEEIELHFHGILIPDSSGRKRCFFVNPHSIMPSSQNTPTTYGFRSGPGNGASLKFPDPSTNDAAAASIKGSNLIGAQKYVEKKEVLDLPPPALPSSLPGTSSAAAAPRYRRYKKALSQFADGTTINERHSYPRYPSLADVSPINNPALLEATFHQSLNGKPIYRPKKQQPTAITPSIPSCIVPCPTSLLPPHIQRMQHMQQMRQNIPSSHQHHQYSHMMPQQQYSVYQPRVMLPRGHRMMLPRLGRPPLGTPPPLLISQRPIHEIAEEENIYDDFIPLTKRVITVDEEENEAEMIPFKRHRSTSNGTGNNGEEPEIITL